MRLLTGVPVLSSVIVAPWRNKLALFVDEIAPLPLRATLPDWISMSVSAPFVPVSVRLLLPTLVIWKAPAIRPLSVRLPAAGPAMFEEPIVVAAPSVTVPLTVDPDRPLLTSPP